MRDDPTRIEQLHFSDPSINNLKATSPLWIWTLDFAITAVRTPELYTQYNRYSYFVNCAYTHYSDLFCTGTGLSTLCNTHVIMQWIQTAFDSHCHSRLLFAFSPQEILRALRGRRPSNGANPPRPPVPELHVMQTDGGSLGTRLHKRVLKTGGGNDLGTRLHKRVLKTGGGNDLGTRHIRVCSLVPRPFPPPVSVFILEAIKNWRRERPGNVHYPNPLIVSGNKGRV